jgi:hypothetical protein
MVIFDFQTILSDFYVPVDRTCLPNPCSTGKGGESESVKGPDLDVRDEGENPGCG